MTDAARGPFRAVLRAERGTLAYAERDDLPADATVTGDEQSWVRAFGPDADRTGLEVTGDPALAATLLEAIVASATA